MTTICFKDGILAADTQMVVNDNRRATCTKIRYLKTGVVIACAGDVNNEAKALKFFSKPTWKSDDPPNLKKKHGFQCILIVDKNPYFCDDALYPQPIEHKYHAIGSGSEFASSAMELGMSAEEAVKFASKLDINTNDTVTTYEVNHAKEKSATKKPKATQ